MAPPDSGSWRAERLLLAFPAEGEQVVQAGLGDRGQLGPQQEPVGERAQHRVVGHLVCGAHRGDERRPRRGRAVMEDPLVDQGEQCIENGAAALEHLVKEGQLAVGQHVVGLHLEPAPLERVEVQRAEQLGGLGEPGQQVAEPPGVDQVGEPVGRGRSWQCRAGRATGRAHGRARRPAAPGSRGRGRRSGRRAAWPPC